MVEVRTVRGKITGVRGENPCNAGLHAVAGIERSYFQTFFELICIFDFHEKMTL